MKKALITGVTGQDGSYLAELLVEKGYKVYGLVRRASTFNTQRIDELIDRVCPERFEWLRADLTDSESLLRVLREVVPDEIYHLAAQSHVRVSFEIPVYTFDAGATGTLRLLEAIRTLGLESRIYNACSSEMFGAAPPPQSESTPFMPQSPYAIAKVAAYHMGRLYREAYGMYIANGILFNHESPRRGETFVTRKVTRAVARITHGLQQDIVLGNLDAYRDWGYAPEYVEAMWRMLQTDTPDDFVIATGERHTVREFVERAFECVGVSLEWQGEGLEEVGLVSSVGQGALGSTPLRPGHIAVRKSAEYYRPAEVDNLCGDATKAKEKLGWKPQVRFTELVEKMVEADLRAVELLLGGTRAAGEGWRKYII